MSSFIDNITEYESTRTNLISKIDAITTKMKTFKNTKQNGYANLLYRRERLYDMLMGIEYTLKEMREYQANIIHKAS